MMKINFNENLKNLRKAKGLTQSKLAQVLSVDQRTISAWEKGICEPSFSILLKLCELFDEDFNGILS